MGSDWGLLLKRSLDFCWRPRRWLPFFIVYLLCTLSTLLYIYFNSDSFLSMLSFLFLGSAAYLPNFFALLAPLLLIWIVFWLIILWIQGSLIYQGWREKEFRKGFEISCSRYPSILGATILVGILAYLASLTYLPTGMAYASNIGLLLSFVASAALYFPLQIVIVKGQGFWNALVGSWQLFRDQAREKLINRKNILLLILVSELVSMPLILVPGYLTLATALYSWLLCWFLAFAFLSLIAFSRVCDAMIITTAVSLAILLVFSIPLLLVLGNILLILQASYTLGGIAVLTGLKSLMSQSVLPLTASGIIALIGLSLSNTFSIKAKTEFYLKFRKRILGVF